MTRRSFLLALGLQAMSHEDMVLDPNHSDEFRGVPDSTSITGTVTSVAHEESEEYYTVQGEENLVLIPGMKVLEWLRGHKGQKVVVTFRQHRGVK